MVSRLLFVLVIALVLVAADGKEDLQETVIFIRKSVRYGQEVLIRGGIAGGKGCTSGADAASDPCAIPISHVDLDIKTPTPKRDSWVRGDNYLTWGGAETGQTNIARGTPAQWTTNNERDKYFSVLNHFGEHYWMVQVEMDCSVLPDGGFFEFKGYVSTGEWEKDISSSRCSGDGYMAAPFYSKNHVGRCGHVNVFQWNSPTCSIYKLPEPCCCD